MYKLAKYNGALFLSLFITHLAVGGELLQYSTDIVYVSANGTGGSSCLNGVQSLMLKMLHQRLI